jgi:hypothetical protein
MMRRAWYVTCDGCGDPAQVDCFSAKGARKLAQRTEGYIRMDSQDLCPRCAKGATRG